MITTLAMDTVSHTENKDISAAQPTPEPPTQRERLLFAANLLLMIGAIGLTVGFFVWRHDKPPNNPGGPLRGMGGAVLFWEWFALAPGPMLAPWSFFNVLRFVGKKIKARYGEPPPLEVNESPAAKRNDVFIAVGCIVAMAYIAYIIATSTPRTVLSTAGLVALSFPFIVGTMPAARADVARWARWLWKQRGAKRETRRS